MEKQDLKLLSIISIIGIVLLLTGVILLIATKSEYSFVCMFFGIALLIIGFIKICTTDNAFSEKLKGFLKGVLEILP